MVDSRWLGGGGAYGRCQNTFSEFFFPWEIRRRKNRETGKMSLITLFWWNLKRKRKINSWCLTLILFGLRLWPLWPMKTLSCLPFSWLLGCFACYFPPFFFIWEVLNGWTRLVWTATQQGLLLFEIDDGIRLIGLQLLREKWKWFLVAFQSSRFDRPQCWSTAI